MKIIRNSFIPFGRYGAINLFGIVFAKHTMPMNKCVQNHEAIHSAQMRELLYIPFYILYVLEWIWNLLFRRGNAYRNISFEKEAYAKERDLDYLKHRKKYAMWRK